MKSKKINILLMILVLTFTCITGIKAATILASSVTYGDTTVKDALDELIEQANNISNGSSEIERQNLYNALQYSGLVTEDMTLEEMYAVLAEAYPNIITLISGVDNINKFGTANINKSTLDSTSASTAFSSPNGLTLAISGSGGQNQWATYCFQTGIDVTGFDTLTYYVSNSTYLVNSWDSYLRFGLQSSFSTAQTPTFVKSGSIVSGERTIDVSNLTGTVYLTFSVHGYSGTITISKMVLS